jgi:hypothetical protein
MTGIWVFHAYWWAEQPRRKARPQHIQQFVVQGVGAAGLKESV